VSHHRLPVRVMLLTLAFVAVAVAHDVVMAANPHAPELEAIARHTLHSHQAGHTGDDATHPEHRPTELHCTSLEAARTVAISVEEPAAATLGPFSASLDPEVGTARAVAMPPGVPPDRTRALLQVWLI
jgi:hypothetical protein